MASGARGAPRAVAGGGPRVRTGSGLRFESTEPRAQSACCRFASNIRLALVVDGARFRCYAWLQLALRRRGVFDALARRGFRMTNRFLASLGAVALAAFVASPALAQSSIKVGTLTCDVSAGIGLLISQQQMMTCTFDPASGGPPDNYTGRIDKFGLALGAVQEGTMVWGVLAPGLRIPAWRAGGNIRGCRRGGDCRRRSRRQPPRRRNRPLIFSAAPYRPRSGRAQFRRRRHDPDPHLGALTSPAREIQVEHVNRRRFEKRRSRLT